MKRTLAGVGLSSLGGGLFLPIGLLYLIAVLDISVAQAGLMMTCATLASLAATSVAGGMVDRFGASPVVVGSRVFQFVGCLLLLASTGPVLAWFALLLLGLGQRSFWASIFALVGTIAGERKATGKDEVFATLAVVETLGTAAGGLCAALAFGLAGSQENNGVYQIALAANAALAAVAAILFLRGTPHTDIRRGTSRTSLPWHTVFRDRVFIRFLVLNTPMALAVSLMAVAIPVFTVNSLDLPGWIPALMLAAVTITSAAFRVPIIRSRAGKSRTRTLQMSAILISLWGVLLFLAAFLPGIWQLIVLTVGLALYVVGEILHGPTVNALTDDVAPAGQTGTYLATLQYAFGVSDVVAPLFVAALGFSAGLPWLVLALMAALAAVLLPAVTGRLSKDSTQILGDVTKTPIM